MRYDHDVSGHQRQLLHGTRGHKLSLHSTEDQDIRLALLVAPMKSGLPRPKSVQLYGNELAGMMEPHDLAYTLAMFG